MSAACQDYYHQNLRVPYEKIYHHLVKKDWGLNTTELQVWCDTYRNMSQLGIKHSKFDSVISSESGEFTISTTINYICQTDRNNSLFIVFITDVTEQRKVERLLEKEKETTFQLNQEIQLLQTMFSTSPLLMGMK